MSDFPPDMPHDFGPDDDPYHDTQSGRWLGWLFLTAAATPYAFALWLIIGWVTK